MSETLFSVVIPTHNGEAYIASVIDSVLSQTYQHFEIIVLEHESTDDTVEIISSYDDPRIRLCSTNQPQTIESNWARILDLELAEYLSILGHDDILYPEFLQEIAHLIAQEPQASLYATHFHIIDSDGRIIRACKPAPYKESGEEYMRARQHFQRDSFGTGYVMRSDDYKRVGGFRPISRLIFADDFAFYSLATLSGKVCSPRYLFGYRYHRKSEAYLSGLETLAEASQQFMSALEETPYAQDPDNMALAREYLNTTFTRRYIRILINIMQINDTVKYQYYRGLHKEFVRRFPQQSFSIYSAMAWIVEILMSLRLAWVLRIVSQLLQRIIKGVRGIKD